MATIELPVFINENPGDFSPPDTMHLLISESYVNSVSESFIRAMTIPTESPTNGNIDFILKEAAKVVFQFYDTTDHGDPNANFISFYRSNIADKKRLPTHYYLELENEIKVPTSSFVANETIVTPTSASIFFTFGFEPSNEETFLFGDYDTAFETLFVSRPSNLFLRIDRSGLSLLPSNESIISSSLIAGERSKLDRRFFSDVQDSNYNSIGYSRARYKGSKSLSLYGASTYSSGSEPAISLSSFTGIIFPSDAENRAIKTAFENLGQGLLQETVYYSTQGLLASGSGVVENGVQVALPYFSLQYSADSAGKLNIEGNILEFEEQTQKKTFVYQYDNEVRNYVQVVSKLIYDVAKGRVHTIDGAGKVFVSEDIVGNFDAFLSSDIFEADTVITNEATFSNKKFITEGEVITNEKKIRVYVNGLLIEEAARLVEDDGTDIVVTFYPGVLGYSVDPGDNVKVRGIIGER